MNVNRVRLARCLLLFLVGAMLLAPAARADIGPKPSLTVQVVNAPEGTLYLDLLTEGEATKSPYPNSNLEEADPAVLDTLRSIEGDGWVLAYTTGVAGRAPVFGSVLPREDGAWQFSYIGLPETFRVAVATEGWARASKTVYTRRFTDHIIYDWESNTVRPVTPAPLHFLLQLLATLIPTLLIEALVLWLFRFREGRTWAVFLAVNLVTQAGLHLACGTVLVTLGYHPLFYGLGLILPELIIWAVECAAFALLLKEHSAKRRVGGVLCANLASFVLGFFPLHLLGPFLNSL